MGGRKRACPMRREDKHRKDEHRQDERRCFECGKPAGQEHHVIPRRFGGRRTVPMCRACHERADLSTHACVETLRWLKRIQADVAFCRAPGCRLMREELRRFLTFLGQVGMPRLLYAPKRCADSQPL